MTWPWLICFSALWAGPLVTGGTVTGQVQLEGGRGSRPAGIVVWLEPLSQTPEAGAAPRTFEMAQKHKAFSPHVLAIPVGSKVNFPNFDPIFHNAFSNFNGQLFDVGLYPPGSTRAVSFRRAGVVRVFCNIHPAMSAVIVVLPTRFYAVTAPSGEFSMSGVPAGEYQLGVFHERATEETLRKLRRKIVLDGATAALPRIVVSETGFLETPHKNKFGRDYEPVVDGFSTYPGERP